MIRSRVAVTINSGSGGVLSRVDGEVLILRPPLEYRHRAHALRVIVP